MLDNVAFHKNERAAELVRQRGAWLLPLPPNLPDLNPIEMVVSEAARSETGVIQLRLSASPRSYAWLP
ncbi:MAG: hypothetical protein EOR43_32305, partial [Mesorhizobium sp.]